MSKGPPPLIKPKPKNLSQVQKVKPAFDKFTSGVSQDNVPSSSTNEDDEFITSLRGNLRKTSNEQPKPARQSINDSIVSKPITMSINADALNSDESEEDDQQKEDNTKPTTKSMGLSSIPPHPIRNTPISPFKKDNLKLNGYPLPPQRNQAAITSAYASNMASPLKKSLRNDNVDNSAFGDVGNDTIDYAEGMRSPLKKNTSFPPPPKRNPIGRNIPPQVNPRKELQNGDDEPAPPSLPARKTTTKLPKSNIDVSDDDEEEEGESAPPKLPARKEQQPALPERRSKPSDPSSRQSTAEPLSEDDYYSDEYADERSIHVANHPKTPQRKHTGQKQRSHYDERYTTPNQRSISARETPRSRHYHNGYNSSSDDDNDYGYDRSRNNREEKSASSQFLQNAKTFSMESLQTAKEKSGPLANKAMGKFSKIKGKLKSSNRGNDNYEYSDDDDDDDETSRYRSMRRETPVKNNSNDKFERRRSKTPPEAPKKPERPASRKPVITNDANKLRQEVDACDVSIDEDRPPLPVRKSSAPPKTPHAKGIPLPGLADDDGDVLKPPHKIKPAIPPKPKPEIPAKKSDTLNIPAPPATRASSNSISSTRSSVPPPPPSRTKAPTAPPSRMAPWTTPDLNLELTSLWWIKDNNFQLPKDLQGLNYQLSHGYVGEKEFKIYGFRLKDLGTLRLKLVWKKGATSPLDSLTSEVDFIPPPPVTKKLLIEGNEKFAEHIASWCEVKEGQMVGNGECWTLAHDALEKACGKYAFVSTGLIHGANIATFTGSNNDIPEISIPSISDDIRRGDILQFKTCVFEYPQRTMTFGAPDHTAIVLEVKPSDDFSKDNRLKWLEITHQNVGGVKKVRVADIDLGKLKSGELKVFRPVEASWVSDLSEVVI